MKRPGPVSPDVLVYDVARDIPELMLWKGDRLVVSPTNTWPVVLVRRFDVDDFAEALRAHGAALEEVP